MTDPIILPPNTQQLTQVTQADARYSRSTIANLNATAEQLVATKKSMLEDLSRGRFSTSQHALDSIMELQKIQDRVDALKASVEQTTTPGFTARDVETIEDLSRQGKSEEQIAALFKTNQSKINRLRNGKSPLEA